MRQSFSTVSPMYLNPVSVSTHSVGRSLTTWENVGGHRAVGGFCNVATSLLGLEED